MNARLRRRILRAISAVGPAARAALTAITDPSDDPFPADHDADHEACVRHELGEMLAERVLAYDADNGTYSVIPR